jgi:protein involved in polysaccharide export with SLBB domain
MRTNNVSVIVARRVMIPIRFISLFSVASAISLVLFSSIGFAQADLRQAVQALSPSDCQKLAEQAGATAAQAQAACNQGVSQAKSSASSVGDGSPKPVDSELPLKTDSEIEPLVSLYPGAALLPRFGYQLFSSSPNTFAPATDIPVPSDYVLGPGDSLEILVIGNQGGRFTLPVTRDGVIEMPQVGPIAVAGMRFLDAKAMVEERISAQISGARASVSIGQLRSIRVFVLGEAKKPGAYTVSGLSTMSNAILASGGVSPIGSLRKIELKRSGRTVATIDLYDFLIKGDTSKDQRLLPGDVIFIPPVGPRVAISGGVKRPAIYEIRPATSITDLIEIAGGFDVNVDRAKATLTRKTEGPARRIDNIDLTDSTALRMGLREGDELRVETMLPTLLSQVTLAGHVHRPGRFGLTPGMRVSDLLPTLEEAKPFADLGYGLIARFNPMNAELSMISFDLRSVLSARGTEKDPLLQQADQILIFESNKPRDPLIRSLFRTDKDQLSANLYKTINVSGEVKVPGSYPFEPGMTVSDIVRAGGGLKDEAYTLSAELVRYRVGDDQTRVREIQKVDLKNAIKEDSAADAPVEPFDELNVRVIPDWSDRATITIEGEVLFPGVYSIQAGDTLRQVIDRAGGLKPTANATGAFFSRRALRQRDLDAAKRLELDLQRALIQQQVERSPSSSSEEGGVGSALAALQALASIAMKDAETNPALGRLAIDLDRILAVSAHSEFDLPVKDGDRLLIPQSSPEVSVVGQVFQPGSFFFEGGSTVDTYLNYAGGVKEGGNRSGIYVVDVAGRSQPIKSDVFSWSRSRSLNRGDTIIVPIRIPKSRNPLLDTLQQSTQIIYNLALGAAALDTLRN